VANITYIADIVSFGCRMVVVFYPAIYSATHMHIHWMKIKYPAD